MLLAQWEADGSRPHAVRLALARPPRRRPGEALDARDRRAPGRPSAGRREEPRLTGRGPRGALRDGAPAADRRARRRASARAGPRRLARWCETRSATRRWPSSSSARPPGPGRGLEPLRAGLPTGRLRAHGELAEIRARDLRVSPEEALELFRAAGVDLGLDDVRRITERTEGWLAGIYLALLGIRDAADPDAFVARFTGDTRQVLEYLQQDVLAVAAPEIRDFLLRTSVLDALVGAALRRRPRDLGVRSDARGDLPAEPLPRPARRDRLASTATTSSSRPCSGESSKRPTPRPFPGSTHEHLSGTRSTGTSSRRSGMRSRAGMSIGRALS